VMAAEAPIGLLAQWAEGWLGRGCGKMGWP
jgi:hypothetical protein